jgi:hypothetical protein
MSSFFVEKVISDARILATDILIESTDSIEKEVFRATNKILGAVFGACVLNMPIGLVMFDVGTDATKLQKIKAKLLNLEMTSLDEKSPDYQKAICARNFQKEVYENLEKYTHTAQKIKAMVGVSAFFFFMGKTLLPFPSLFPSELALAFMGAGLLVNIPGAAYGLYHWISEGNKLEGVKQTLAKQAISQLSLKDS